MHDDRCRHGGYSLYFIKAEGSPLLVSLIFKGGIVGISTWILCLFFAAITRSKEWLDGGVIVVENVVTQWRNSVKIVA